MPELPDIPLNEIVRDLRVKEYVRKEAIRLAKINIAKFKNNQSQILSCHAWLLPLHYLEEQGIEGEKPSEELTNYESVLTKLANLSLWF